MSVFGLSELWEERGEHSAAPACVQTSHCLIDSFRFTSLDVSLFSVQVIQHRQFRAVFKGLWRPKAKKRGSLHICLHSGRTESVYILCFNLNMAIPNQIDQYSHKRFGFLSVLSPSILKCLKMHTWPLTSTGACVHPLCTGNAGTAVSKDKRVSNAFNWLFMLVSKEGGHVIGAYQISDSYLMIGKLFQCL